MDSLTAFARTERLGMGLEGWLRAELVVALSGWSGVRVARVQKEGPDVVLEAGGRQILLELKGSGKKESAKFAVEGARQYRVPGTEYFVPCLFLTRPRGDFADDLRQLKLEEQVETLGENFIVGLTWYP